MSFELFADGRATDWADYASVEHRNTRKQEGDAMALTLDNRRRTHSKFKRAESLEFRLIFIAAFAMFLVTVTVERVLRLSWLRRERPNNSILEQAKQAANTCAAYAFMG
ncbi:MAG: hypothetical protein ACT4OU_01265 [Hyphomicrobium sp.]